ncbi:hypothetical protein H4R34_002532 [Dimargaris verticillata]|uniref:Peroxin-7 n=1 Tax=Dimargaris verticillata TaxID=2761393 RepID=A0A9W8B3Q5_9FUNG|nr:hypothetical protein H4R34_002532 [Dimargaris verticillata]
MGEPGFPTVPYHTVRQTTRWPPQPTKSVRRLGFPRRHLDTPLNSVVATRYLQYFTHRPSDVYRFAHVSERGAPLFACQFQPSTASSRPLVAATNEEGTLFLVDAKSSSQWVDGTTGVGNVQPAEQVFTSWSAHGNAIFDVQWSQDGRQLLTASGDQTVKLWDVERQIDVAMFPAHDASVKSVSWSFQNPFTFASAGRDGKIVIWDQRCASTVNDHNQRVHRPGDIIHAAHSVRDLANPRSIGAGTQRLNATLLRAAGAMKKPLHGRLGTRGRGSGRIPVLSGMRQSRRKTNARPLANNGQSVTAVLYMPHRDHCVASAGVVNRYG